ncbi:MFS transporter [Vineibacter terrae]|uniref:MFS transporter n=1 Tax=Vineibacter terrae TaxID=2586908 RepID=UPI002E32243C|nr:MFS transporter [Vineibacter terrae]HEX2888796.1 MFS transporter [Vineibacter terrae]
MTALICGSLVITLSMGVRQVSGLFLRPVVDDLNFSREIFGLAVGLQNLVWGLTQPVAGLLADRLGARWVVVGAGVCYALGLGLAAVAPDSVLFVVGLGVLAGLGQSGTTFAVILAVIGRLTPPAQRSRWLGVGSAAGSIGMFVMVPATSILLDLIGWRSAMLVLVGLVAMTALLALGLDEAREPEAADPGAGGRGAVAVALADRDYWLLNLGFASCGFQLAFVATYLPTMLTDGALSTALAAGVLACIGAFNIPGTYLAGAAGGRYRKTRLLAVLYLARGAAMAGFLALPLSSASALVFAALFGLLWTATVPLTSGLVADLWGRRDMGLLFGLAMVGHQLGAFAGAWAGGFAFDRTGSFMPVWLVAIGLSLTAALCHAGLREQARPCALQAGAAG